MNASNINTHAQKSIKKKRYKIKNKFDVKSKLKYTNSKKKIIGTEYNKKI